MAKLPKSFARFLAEALIGPALATVGHKVGEAVGDVLGYHINPPEPETPEPEPELPSED